MLPFGKSGVTISGGFWLLSGWFLLVNGWKPLLILLTAAALHELGHFLVLNGCGAELRGIRINLLGASMEIAGGTLSYGAELAALLAGPAVNLLCAALLAGMDGERWSAVIGAHLILGCLNLLPIRPLDGGRALETLISWKLGPSAGEQTIRAVGGGTALLLFGGTLRLMEWSGGNLWLLPPAAAMLMIAAAEWAGKGSLLTQR